MSETTEFRFHEQLKVAVRDIERLYHPADIKVYRTFITKPISQKDLTPQTLRGNEDDAMVTSGLDNDAYQALPEKKKKEYISKRSLSVNITKEAAVQAAKTTYRNVAEKYGEDYAELFMKNERGTYVGGVVLKPHEALITAFDRKGHAEVILDQNIGPDDVEIFDELVEFDYKDE